MQVLVNYERRDQIFGQLLQLFRERRYPFNQRGVEPPQAPNNLPRNLLRGGREHAIFLFCLCFYMRGGIKSVTAIKAMARLYELYPSIFEPDQWEELNADAIASLLRSVGLNFSSKAISKAWIENFRRLKTRWGGDPRELVRGVSTYEEALARIRRSGQDGFLGFREKMVSMLLYFLAESKIIEPFVFPLPVDFHVCRIVLANEIVVVKDPTNGDLYQKEVLDAIRALSIDYCHSHGVDPIDLCHAIWLFSQAMCNKHPGNNSVVERIRRGRKTGVEALPVTWSQAQVSAFKRSCGSCTAAETCRWCIPSASYYIQGKLILRGVRETPPQILSQIPLFSTI